MIDDVRSILKNMRTNVDNEFQDWFKEAKQIANEVGAHIRVPRYAHRQQTPHYNTSSLMLADLSWIISTKK